MKKISLLFLIISVTTISCYYDSEEELYGSPQCKSSGISYKNDVSPIIGQYCNNCHFSGSTIGAGINLVGYNAVLPYVNNKSLIGSIKHTDFSPMPKGQPKLNSCNIKIIETWIQEGFPNN